MKIYVAGSRQNIEQVRHCMNELRKAGHEITHDWVADIDRLGDDRNTDKKDLLECAKSDITGLSYSELFWLLSPSEGGSGCFIEFGMVLGLRVGEIRESISTGRRLPPRIIISGDINRSLFFLYAKELCNAKLYQVHVDALMYILQLGNIEIETENQT
jgi:hypothetical protein